MVVGAPIVGKNKDSVLASDVGSAHAVVLDDRLLKTMDVREEVMGNARDVPGVVDSEVGVD